MRAQLFIALLPLALNGFCQNALDLIDLLGKAPSEVDLTEYLGSEIDTVRSATWRFQAKKKGVMVQAHPIPNDQERSVITTVTFYFTKDGYRPFKGQLIHGMDADRPWKKNRAKLYHKAGFKDLKVVLDLTLGTEVRYEFHQNETEIYVSALYLHDEKGWVSKRMYSLELSILSWE